MLGCASASKLSMLIAATYFTRMASTVSMKQITIDRLALSFTFNYAKTKTKTMMKPTLLASRTKTLALKTKTLKKLVLRLS